MDHNPGKNSFSFITVLQIRDFNVAERAEDISFYGGFVGKIFSWHHLCHFLLFIITCLLLEEMYLTNS